MHDDAAMPSSHHHDLLDIDTRFPQEDRTSRSPAVFAEAVHTITGLEVLTATLGHKLDECHDRLRRGREAGRRRKEDDIDPAAGFVLHKKVGDSVEENETLATLHTNNDTVTSDCKDGMLKAITLSENKPDKQKQITHRVDKDGIHDYKS